MFDSRLPLPDSKVNLELDTIRQMLPFYKVSVEDEMLLYTVNVSNIYDLVGEVNQMIGGLNLNNIVAIPHRSFFGNDSFEIRAKKQVKEI